MFWGTVNCATYGIYILVQVLQSCCHVIPYTAARQGPVALLAFRTIGHHAPASAWKHDHRSTWAVFCSPYMRMRNKARVHMRRWCPWLTPSCCCLSATRASHCWDRPGGQHAWGQRRCAVWCLR